MRIKSVNYHLRGKNQRCQLTNTCEPNYSSFEAKSRNISKMGLINSEYSTLGQKATYEQLTGYTIGEGVLKAINKMHEYVNCN